MQTNANKHRIKIALYIINLCIAVYHDNVGSSKDGERDYGASHG